MVLLVVILKLNFSVQLGPKFMREKGFKHVTFSTADGALEAAPAVRFAYLFLSSFSDYFFF